MRRRAAIVGALGCLASVAMAQALGEGQLNVGINTADRIEKVKTVPITRQPWANPRVVASVAADKLGPVHAGDSVGGYGEVEVSVTCLEPMPQCVGSLYDYSPDVRARFVLGDTATAHNGYEVGRPIAYECSQDLPNRNHHCVITIARTAPIRSEPACQGCHLNLVLTAFHSGAKRRDRLVVGADGEDGIHQRKASIAGAVFGSDPVEFPGRRLLSSHQVVTRRLPVDESNPGAERRVLGSVRLPKLVAGESLVVDARARVGIRRLGYNALLQSQMIVSTKRGSTRRNGQPHWVVSWDGRADAMNGFNCTRGPSGFDHPCLIHKVAAIKVLRDARAHPLHQTGRRIPLFLNLVSGSSGEYEYRRHWHSGDRAKVRRIQMDVWRYPAAG